MAPSAFDRVVRHRPAPDRLRLRMFDQALPVTWAAHAVDRYAIEDGDVSIHLGPEHERAGDIVRYLATLRTKYEGDFAVILSIRPGRTLPDDDGTCELGGVLHYAPAWYLLGATLEQLSAAGFVPSSHAARWLYLAGRQQLDEEGVYGDLAPPTIKLALTHRPYSRAKTRPGYLGTHGAAPPDAREELPPVFAFSGTPRAGTDSDRTVDRIALATAIADMTRHPDAALADLLRDRDAAIGEPETVELDAELAAMWRLVVQLDPAIDTHAAGVTAP